MAYRTRPLPLNLTSNMTAAGCALLIAACGGSGPSGESLGIGGSGGGAYTETGGAGQPGGTGGEVAATGGWAGGAGDNGGGTWDTGGNGATGGSGGEPAGTGGSTGGQAGSGGGASVSGPECPAGAFLCEGFESYASGAPPDGGWTREGGARQESGPGTGVTDVDTTQVYSGQKALHVTGKLVEDQSSIRKTLDIEDPIVFVRLMMYTVSYPDNNIHTRLVSLGTDRERNTYSLGGWNAVAIEKINSVYLQDANTRFSAAEFKNRWTCWEFSLDQTGGMGKVVPKIYVDGKELPLKKAGSASHGMTTDSWDPIDLKVFWLGLFGYQRSNEGYDYWIDDVIVHSERIGCPAAE